MSQNKEPIVLKTKLIVTEVNRKSKSPALNGVKRYDVLHLSVTAEAVGRNSRGTHAAYIKVKNERTGETSYVSFNMTGTFFSAIEYEVAD